MRSGSSNPAEYEYTAHLCHCFDLKHARHDRLGGEVAGKRKAR